MWQRFTERARRVVFFAQEEAARMGENKVGTEYLLLGLVRDSDSVAARVLERLAIPLPQIRQEIERQVTRGHGSLGHDMQLTPRAKRVIDLAYEEARQLNNGFIGTEHILLGLIREGDGLGAQVLVKLGAQLAPARAVVQDVPKVVESGTPDSFAIPEVSRLRRLMYRTQGEAQEIPAAETPGEVLKWFAERVSGGDFNFYTREVVRGCVEAARLACKDLPHLRAIPDLTMDQAWALLSLGRVLKHTLKADLLSGREVLAGKTLAMIFEKPSLRTRVSFETGMFQLGGHAIYLQPSDIAMGKRETVADTAAVLARIADGIMARVFAHATVQELAAHSIVPVINGLCDREHPCQALSDYLTIWERRGAVAGQRVAYVGDGNNMAHSLMLLGAKLGAHIGVACPPGYEPDAGILAQSQADAAASGGSVAVTHDPQEACRDADAIYTDVWTSMGQEAETAARLKAFQGFQVNEALCALAKPDHLFLHCLPAHRGEEVTAAVADGPNSAIFQQAENRLHAQKAVLAVLL